MKSIDQEVLLAKELIDKLNPMSKVWGKPCSEIPINDISPMGANLLRGSHITRSIVINGTSSIALEAKVEIPEIWGSKDTIPKKLTVNSIQAAVNASKVSLIRTKETIQDMSNDRLFILFFTTWTVITCLFVIVITIIR